MRYYLDTSSLRKLSPKLSLFSWPDIFTSSLAVFELISGMQESEFNLRKSVITNLLTSSISIDFESFDMKKHRCIGLDIEDIDGTIIKEMAELIINAPSFEDLLAKRVKTKNDEFTLNDFTLFDDQLSKESVANSKIATAIYFDEIDKEDRKRDKQFLINENNIFRVSQIFSEIAISKMIEALTDSKRPSEEYFKYAEKYNNGLDLFFFCLVCKAMLCQLHGNIYGRNDYVDILHTCFITRDDIIVSDDKIFKSIQTECSGPICYTSNEFLELVYEKRKTS